MKKKILWFSIALILLVVVGTFAYLNFFSKKTEKLFYLNDTLEPSLESSYLQESIPNILKYLDTNEVKTNTFFSQMGIKSKEKCLGTVVPNGNVYTVSASCKNNSSGYDIKYILTKGITLETLDSISEVTGGYIFSGTTSESGVIGFLDKNGNLKWQTKINFAEKQHAVYNVIEIDDGYVFFDQTLKKSNNSVYMIKLDKNGKFLFNKKVLDSSLYYHPKYNGIDTFMVSTYEKVVIVDKMGNIVSSFKTKLLKNITYEQGNVYYLTQDQELVIADIKGKIKSSFNLKKLDDSILSLEVINDKIMVVEQNQVSIYNLNGELHKVFDYNDLTVSEDKYNGERQKPVLYSSVKFNNNIYMNWFLASYSMVDCYDQNMELVNRKLYKNSFEDVAAFNYNTTIMMGEEVSNYKYSNEYKMFIKTVYDK